MAEEDVTDDDIAKMLEQIYKEADKEMDESEESTMIQMMQGSNRQADGERHEDSNRPLDFQFKSHQHTMKPIAENRVLERIESSPSIDSTSGSDSRRSERSNSNSPGDSRSYYSQSPSRSPGDSRSYSGSRSYSDSRRSSSYSRDSRSNHSSEGSRSPSPSGSRSRYSEELSEGATPEQAPTEDPFPDDKPEETDDHSDLSSQSSSDGKCTVAGLAIVLCFIIGAGLGIGFGVAAATKEDKPATTPPANSTGGGGITDQGAAGGIKLLDAKNYSFFGGEETAATKEASDVSACLEFCKEYDAMQYLYVEDLCTCYNSVSCLMSWGPKVDTTSYQFVGDLYTKDDELEVCSDDYCQALDDKDGLCFTANSQDYQDYSLHGANMVEREAQTVETLDECLDLCAPYDAASFLNWKECTCYDQADCWLEWGDSVGTQLVLGKVYSKKPLDVCAETYCEVNQDIRCFKGNVQDSKEYTVFGTVVIQDNSTSVGTVGVVEGNTTSVSSEEECLELCAPYDAASFLRPNICTCYENPTCWLEWGENVDTSLFFGNVYSTMPLDICESDYCEVNTQDSLCFTGNEEDCRFYALYGKSMVPMASGQTPGSLQDCLDLCAPYDGAAFENFADCSCYNNVQCKLRWGDEIDSENFFGTIYTKRGLEECELDYCDIFENDGLCFTGNTQSYSGYSLFGSSLEETAASNDVNSKDECLDFCKKYDSVQYLNFQDPKCKCYNGAECWLAWPPDQTDTNSVEYTGDVYSKKELQFCSFDYCSQFAEGQLCAVGNNRQ
mmetsp:Transcript_29533/g.70998  ORF Transcript_29533/g.70998 Transcript_29533/m.70998 type:complete len:782 (+) Transcript_29533:239-2584(+)